MITAHGLQQGDMRLRLTFSIEMDEGAYERHYQSTVQPRFRMIEYGEPRRGTQQRRTRKLLVDLLEYADWQDAADALNAPPAGAMH